MPIAKRADSIASYDKVYVVENNFDGQYHKILLTETPAQATRLISVAKCDGMALSARFITESIWGNKGAITNEYCNEPHANAAAAARAPKTDRIGLEKNDYKGRDSTLCKGCGHDSISARIINATWELGLDPSQVIKLSGIGCSSKTPPTSWVIVTALTRCMAVCLR